MSNKEDSTCSKRFRVTGMSCSACSARVERAVTALDGIEEVQVNLLTGTMRVCYESARQTEAGIIHAVESAGYGATLQEDAGSVRTRSEEKAAALKKRFFLSLTLLVPLVLLQHLWAGIPGSCAQLLILLPIVWLNRAFFVSGTKSLLKGAPNMDTLISLGAGAAIIDGLWNLCVLHNSADYLESAGMILSLITFGKWLEARATGQTGHALEKLMALLPDTALLLSDDGEATAVPAESVPAGALLLVRPGDRIALDGQVTQGCSAVDESALTGESMPVEKNAGDKVYAGTVNCNGVLHIRTSGTRGESSMAGIIRLVGETAAEKAPIARLADRISGVFVPSVILLALLTAAGWMLAGEAPQQAITHAIAVLVISCPCALGLATPVAMMVGTGRGAGHGILYRNAEAVETAGRVDCVILDKTGTLTSGKPTVTDILPAPGHSEAELLALAAALEAESNHPLALAIAARAGAPGSPASYLSYLPGRGVEGEVDGHPCAAGNAALMRERGVPTLPQACETWAQEGKSVVHFARGGELVGSLALADTLKPDSAQAVQLMKRMGLRVLMMTGDSTQAAQTIANRVGIMEVMAEVLPQDKEAMVRRLQEQGNRVAMVGDGINDAPALMRADVGIAIGTGTDIAQESADIILMRSGLCDAVGALRLSRAMLTNIRQNLFWAFAYNSLAIPLAAGALIPLTGTALHPGVAAAAMGLSSFCVVTNALRLRRFKLIPTPSQPEISDMNTQVTLKVEGMMCPHCERHVTEALTAIEGVSACTADHKAKTVVLTLSAPVDEALLRQAIEKAGYKVL